MINRPLRKTTIAALGAVALALAACESDTPVSPTSQMPTVPGAEASSAPGSTPGVFFRDDFNGTAVDTSRWRAYAQSGVILVRDGKLELLNTGKQPNFPYVVMKDNALPKQGAYYVEFNYEFLASGNVSFTLDHLPPDSPGQESLTTPFMRTGNVRGDMRVYFDIEKDDPVYTIPDAYEEGASHKLRLECDGQNNFRLFFDQFEVGSFTTERRPLKFWVGQYPLRDVNPTLWPRLTMDYVACGVLSSATSAAPLPTPTPKPTPTPAPTPEPAAEPATP